MRVVGEVFELRDEMCWYLLGKSCEGDGCSYSQRALTVLLR